MLLEFILESDTLKTIKRMIPFTNKDRAQLLNINFSLPEDKKSLFIWAADGHTIVRERVDNFKFKGDWADFGVEAKELNKCLTASNLKLFVHIKGDPTDRTMKLRFQDKGSDSAHDLKIYPFEMASSLNKLFDDKTTVEIQAPLAPLIPVMNILTAIPAEEHRSLLMHLDEHCLFFEPEPHEYGEVFLEAPSFIRSGKTKAGKTDSIGFNDLLLKKIISYLPRCGDTQIRISLQGKLSPVKFTVVDNPFLDIILMPMSIKWKSRLQPVAEKKKKEKKKPSEAA